MTDFIKFDNVSYTYDDIEEETYQDQNSLLFLKGSIMPSKMLILRSKKENSWRSLAETDPENLP